MNRLVSRSLSAFFTSLALVAILCLSCEVFGEDKKEKSKPSASNSGNTEQLQTGNVSESSEFCASVGSCRPLEVQSCPGWGTHVCVTIGNSRYFCHDCGGRGECKQKLYCGGDSWYCEKIKSK